MPLSRTPGYIYIYSYDCTSRKSQARSQSKQNHSSYPKIQNTAQKPESLYAPTPIIHAFLIDAATPQGESLLPPKQTMWPAATTSDTAHEAALSLHVIFICKFLISICGRNPPSPLEMSCNWDHVQETVHEYWVCLTQHVAISCKALICVPRALLSRIRHPPTVQPEACDHKSAWKGCVTGKFGGLGEKGLGGGGGG